MGMFARAATKAFDQGVGTIAAGAHILQTYGGRSVTGLVVSTDKAMRYSAFWAAVRMLSEDQAKLPLGIFEQLPDGSTRPAPEHPLERVIRYQANPQMSAFNARETGMAHDLTWGNAVMAIARDKTGNVRELWPLAVDRLEIERDPDGELRYDYQRQNGTRETLRSADVFHVPGLAWDGVKGYSILRQARETVGLGLATEEHGARFFGNGASVNFAITAPKGLSDTAWNHLNASVKERRTGLSNAWMPWVLEEGLTPTILSVPHDDAQWLQTRKHQVTDTARWFRIPPHKLADLEHATFTNIEHQSLEYVTDALMGWLARWEAAIGMQLLMDDWIGLGGRFYAKFNVNALLRGDFQTRMLGYATGMQWGFQTPNQIAELEEWPKIVGGDSPLQPLTHVRAADVDKNGMTYAQRIHAAFELVRVGYEPDAVNAALQLPPITHTGLVPVTVQIDPSSLPPTPTTPTTPAPAATGSPPA